jgi:hypothetical protein
MKPKMEIVAEGHASLIACPKCRREMRLMGVERESPQRDLFTFECDECETSKLEASASHSPSYHPCSVSTRSLPPPVGLFLNSSRRRNPII